MIRIRVTHTPTMRCIDGVQLGDFRVGTCYEVGNLLGALFLAEGWAEPVESTSSDVISVTEEFESREPSDSPPNLIRELFPAYYRGPTSMVADYGRALTKKPDSSK